MELVQKYISDVFACQMLYWVAHKTV